MGLLILTEGRWLRALTFVAVRYHVRYIGGLPVQTVVHWSAPDGAPSAAAATTSIPSSRR
jgi:hypothetical protein